MATPETDKRVCPRCGVRRAFRKTHKSNLCRSCHSFKFTDAEPLTGGRWVRDGLTWRWEEHWLAWAERDAIKASWRRRQEAA